VKPLIRMCFKLWCCAAADWQRTRIVGMGFTPKDAYGDWVALGGKGSDA
jgi:hypothetical protein